MGFFKKLTQTLLGSFLDSPKPAKKKKKSASPVSAKAKKPVKKVKAVSRPKPKSKPKPKPKPKLKPKAKVKAKKALKKPAKKQAPIPGTLIGHVTHFFPQVNAAALRIESGSLSVGDDLYFKGATTDFEIKIKSMQINRVPVTAAQKGAEIGILVKKRVREGDQVYKLS